MRQALVHSIIRAKPRLPGGYRNWRAGAGSIIDLSPAARLPECRTCLFGSPRYARAAGLNEWVEDYALRGNFLINTVSASANDRSFVSLPITADPKVFHLCYRGEGAGNQMTKLLDDASVVVATGVPTVSQWGMLAMLLAILSLGSIGLLRNRVRSST